MVALKRHIAFGADSVSYGGAVLAFGLLNHFQVATCRIGRVALISALVLGAVGKGESDSLTLKKRYMSVCVGNAVGG